ncbi:uncharacterized protein LOC142553281 isoform X1 [Primulina tabacum]|uniref:uncharacterized protein LOC142553281 isoform X1 n=1 Tax=Primulina tabacum TaxID=48773 RepID=UPI003F5A273B
MMLYDTVCTFVFPKYELQLKYPSRVRKAISKSVVSSSKLIPFVFLRFSAIRESANNFILTATRVGMATEQPKPATEEAKMDLFEDDDEFEEFEIDYELEDKEEAKEALQQWEDDWDDDDLNDDFSLQLRRELEGNAGKNEAKST